MTPQEEQRLVNHRQETREYRKIRYRALVFWGMLAICWLAALFSSPDKGFTFTDSLLLMAIILNVGNILRELRGNKRTAAERRAQPDNFTQDNH